MAHFQLSNFFRCLSCFYAQCLKNLRQGTLKIIVSELVGNYYFSSLCSYSLLVISLLFYFVRILIAGGLWLFFQIYLYFNNNYKLGRKMRHFLVLMANFSFEAVSDSNAAGWNIRNSDF